MRGESESRFAVVCSGLQGKPSPSEGYGSPQISTRTCFSEGPRKPCASERAGISWPVLRGKLEEVYELRDHSHSGERMNQVRE